MKSSEIKSADTLFQTVKMATLTRIRGGDIRGRPRDIYYCLTPSCSVLSYSKLDFERHLAGHKIRDKAEDVEDEFNFGDENVADNDMNDSININLDEILLPSGRSDHDTLVKPAE